MSEQKHPQYLHCEACRVEWIAAYLPMEAGLVGRIIKGSRCPMCGGTKDRRMGQLTNPTGDGDAEGWVGNGDTGTSSLTIWAVLMRRVSPHGHMDIPYDPDDFGRCYRLLKVMPSWRERLAEVAAVCPQWAPFVEAWGELTALYEDELENGPVTKGVRMAPRLYARMRELRGRAA
jgi:hypothetical protein